MQTHYDSDGNPIAWTDDGDDCENEHCLQAIKEGRHVHIIPHLLDPREEQYTLAMPNYHFRTVEEALAALEEAWSTENVAHTTAERDAFYAQGVPVKITEGIR